MHAYPRKSINKRGAELTDNVLSIIIAVIVIAAFVFGAYKLFTVYRNQESENAQNMIDVINGKINALQDGQNGTFLIQGFEQKQHNWFIVSWNSTEITIPDKCNYQSCICICPDDVSLTSVITETGGSKSRLQLSCQQTGFCRQVQGYNVVAGTYEYSSINSVNPVIRDPDISAGSTVFEIFITKQKGLIDIFDKYVHTYG